MGNKFPILWMSLCFFKYSLVRGDGTIKLPPSPRPVLPHKKTQMDADEDLKRKLNTKKKANLRIVKKQKKKKDPKKELFAEVIASRPYKLFIGVSLVYPQVQVSGPRKSYTSEITSHIHLAYRFGEDKNFFGEYQVFSGLRIANFSGVGIYQNLPARYSFTYIGPVIGVGVIDPLKLLQEQQVDRAAVSADYQPKTTIIPVRGGWLLNGGIAWQVRQILEDKTVTEPEGEFNTTQGAPIDGSGIWLEFSYLQIYYGAMGLHYSLGAQQGDGKLFTWIGVSAAGWY